MLTRVKPLLNFAGYDDLFGFSHLQQHYQVKVKWTLEFLLGGRPIGGQVIWVLLGSFTHWKFSGLWFGTFTTLVSMSALLGFFCVFLKLKDYIVS